MPVYHPTVSLAELLKDREEQLVDARG